MRNGVVHQGEGKETNINTKHRQSLTRIKQGISVSDIFPSFLLSFFLCFSLSLFFLFATPTLLPPPVHLSHSFVFTISLRFPHCTLPTIAPAVHSNIPPSSNFHFLSSPAPRSVDRSRLLVLHLTSTEQAKLREVNTLTSSFSSHIPGLSLLNTS